MDDVDLVGITPEDLAELRDDNQRMREQLAAVADEWAELGKIPDTPHSKRRWIDGGF